jgi:2-oxoglutarate dehydrogenase E1 component
MSEYLERLRSSAAYSGGNAAFIEALYESFLEDPESVTEGWRKHFETLPREYEEAPPDTPHGPIRANFERLAKERHRQILSSGPALSAGAAAKQAAVLRLINAHRVRGHQNAQLDPLALREMIPVPELHPEYHGLNEGDMRTSFNTGSLFAPERMELREILSLVREVYTGKIGSEYMHITDTKEKRWIQQRLETYRGKPELTTENRQWMLRMLTAAEGLEKYLHTRYVGQKRFSLEGGDSLIPLLDELLDRSAAKGIREVVIGMAHRGRLNVLVNILGKPPQDLFDEFEGRGKRQGIMTSGDVKYHMGFASDVQMSTQMLHVALGFNPSHLEIIGPVIEGSVRARQQKRGDKTGSEVLPVIIHGDAAFAGQGVVMETFNLYQARGYQTGGSVHVVVNNQIGFTTSDPLDSRSTTYCSDVAKMVQAPIFHVNGDDPEAVIFVTRLALDYRNQFRKDVVIDLVCYRRHGHNEADEPAVTQPMMYKKIRNQQPVRAAYADRLIAEGLITPEMAQAMVDQYRSDLEAGQSVSRPVVHGLSNPFAASWSRFVDNNWTHEADTSVPLERLQALGGQMLTAPGGWTLHPRVQRIVDDRFKMAAGDQLTDWGFGENLAYATLLDDGFPIRISGQDCRRGTFFHRHAMFRNQETGESYLPLQHLRQNQPNFTVIDSVLSEEAVLAYEWGYAAAEPDSLIAWEAQFGDFANGAQVVIDQFISSAGAKWGLQCGLVMMLPHGYEGQGPEHSSARIERYMQLCAEHNMQVCLPTTPAQIFHLLRRQLIRPYRRPLVIMTPKSLLRHPLATSPLEQYAKGQFCTVIDEIDTINAADVTRVVMCTGKVFYDLLEARRARSINDIAIIRLEQLYPFPRTRFNEVAEGYPNANSFVWCQEEPQNQGAWDQIKHRFHTLRDANKAVYYVGRPSAAAPATGVFRQHQEEQEKLVDDALSGRYDPEKNRRH